MHLRLHYPDNRDYATDKLFQNAEFLRIPTNGNGGCAIHSVFGNTLNEYDQLILPSCREFLHEQLGQTATEYERRVDDTFLFSAWVENDVWKDTIFNLIKHRLKGNLEQQLANVEPERRALWNAIERDAQVYATLQNLVEAEQEQEEAFRESRRHMVEAFSCVCQKSLKECFLHPLLKQISDLRAILRRILRTRRRSLFADTTGCYFSEQR